MKKLLKKLLVTVVVCVGIASAFNAPAQSFYSASFLNNGQDLQVADKSTNAFGGTNVYSKFNSIFGPAYSLTSTNLYFTNTTGIVFTNWSQPLYTNTSVIQDLPLWVDRDGTTPTSLSISAHYLGASGVAGSTNWISLQFAGLPIGTGPSYPAATDAGHLFQFTFQENGTNDSVVVTNIINPTWLNGCAGVRLLAVVATNSNTSITGSNGVIRSIRLNGFH